MKEYFYFTTEAEARAFFIECLALGIYVSFDRKDNIYGVHVDVEKTLEAKNAKS